MTQEDHKRFHHLLELADAAVDFEFVDIKLVSYFHALREDMGLAKLLILTKEYIETNGQQSQSPAATLETQQSNQNQVMVQ